MYSYGFLFKITLIVDGILWYSLNTFRWHIYAAYLADGILILLAFNVFKVLAWISVLEDLSDSL